jgi:hypothetical protein
LVNSFLYVTDKENLEDKGLTELKQTLKEIEE